jgi:hypothetical protein
LSPTLTLGDHNYLQYFRKFSCKYELFWLSGSEEKKFSMTSPNFHDHLPFEEDLALYLNNFKFPLSKDDLTEIGLLVLENIFIFDIWFSLLSPPPDPRGP